MTLLHPATGTVRAKGTPTCTNAVLHPWLREELSEILKELAPRQIRPYDDNARREEWEQWQKGLTMPLNLPPDLPELRMILVFDNLQGHKSAELVNWLINQGILPLYTPIGGSWLNLTESVQNIIAGRALSGEHPENPEQIIEWLEATVRGWNKHPTAFHWGAERAARRSQARLRRHFIAKSGGYVMRKLSRRPRK
jgi:hypothetical protein